MSDRLDALVARKYTDNSGNEKTAFTKIGVAFAMRNGGYSLSLEALPLPQMGERGLETRILLMVPKPRDEGQAPRGGRQQGYGEASGGNARQDHAESAYGSGEDDGEMPF